MKSKIVVVGFVGALVPLLWGILAMLLFNLKEGVLSEVFWSAVYVTCPFWVIEGNKALWLMPVLNAILYGGLAAMYFNLRARS